MVAYPKVGGYERPALKKDSERLSRVVTRKLGYGSYGRCVNNRPLLPRIVEFPSRWMSWGAHAQFYLASGREASKGPEAA